MDANDRAILELLIEDSRMSFAEIGRRVGLSRGYTRARIQQLVDEGVIEKFTAVVNPVKMGRAVSAFVDARLRPDVIERYAQTLGAAPEVVSLYLMSDMQSLHIHTLTDTEADRVRAADGPQQGRSREVLPPASRKPHAIYRGPRASYLKHLCRRRVDAGSPRPSGS
jgi:DNA-binding Lrp family transcriptional regulator